MVAGFAVSLLTMVLLNVFAIVSAFFFSTWFAVIAIYLSIPYLCYVVFAMIGWDDGQPGSALRTIVGVFLTQILTYSIAYWRSGLLFSGSAVEVTFLDAVYFSITTWTTTGYGDFAPIPRMRLIASSESLLGIFSMGIFIGVVYSWIQMRTEIRLEVLRHNAGLTPLLGPQQNLTEPKIAEEPNKSVQPTPGSVTPRAKE